MLGVAYTWCGLSTMRPYLPFLLLIVAALFRATTCLQEFKSVNLPEEKRLCNKYLKAVCEKHGWTGKQCHSENGRIDDMRLSVSQWKSAIEEVRRSTRKRRSTIDFEAYPYAKWPLPIKYSILPEYEAIDRARIEKALKHWEANTCIRFKEIPDDDWVDKLIFINEDACSSYVGFIGGVQPLFAVTPDCTNKTSAIVHEIGHALGFFHEQGRQDRDDYVKILEENIDELALIEYEKLPEGEDTSLGVPYDVSSCMHYKMNEFSIDPTKNTMETVDPKLQQAITNWVGLSWSDGKQANIMYCNDTCEVKLPCLHEGYTDPNDCSRCKCPDGLGGRFCQHVGEGLRGNSVHSLCCPSNSQEMCVYPYREVCVETNNCEAGKNYYSDGICEFRFWAPYGRKLEARFVDQFGIAQESSVCLHWVEIKYGKDKSLRGPRYCGYKRPTDVITSEGDSLVVIMNAVYPNVPEDLTVRKQFPGAVGFKLCVIVQGCKPFHPYGRHVRGCSRRPRGGWPRVRIPPPEHDDPPVYPTTPEPVTTTTPPRPAMTDSEPTPSRPFLSPSTIRRLKKRLAKEERKLAKLQRKLRKLKARYRVRAADKTMSKIKSQETRVAGIKRQLGV